VDQQQVEKAAKIIKGAGRTPETYRAGRLAAAMGISEDEASALIQAVIERSEQKKIVEIPDGSIAPLSDRIFAWLKKRKRPASLAELADEFDRGPSVVRAALDELKARGVNVLVKADKAEVSGDVEPGNRREIVHNVKDYHTHEYRIGLVGDNHLGSKYERLDVLNALYDLYASEGVTHVYNTGNWIEGESSFNRHDLKVFGLDEQIRYFLDNYPQQKGIETRFIAGDDHEGWYQIRESIEIGRHAENMAKRAGRDDLKYIGYLEANVEFRAPGGSRMLKVMHPGGGSAYALSYAAQKLVESFQGGEKPQLLAYGHYHKFDYNYAREIHCIGTGCTCDQSVFMRKRKIQAHVGGVMLVFNQAPDGTINRVRVEWIPFYDRDSYANRRRFGMMQYEIPIVEAERAA